MTAQSAVRLTDVTLRLGNHDFDFDLDVPAGGFLAVTGPSGAGKSTLFNVIAGFDAPSGGSVEIGGRDMADLEPGKRPVSLVFQDNNLFAHLDIFTNVALGVSPALKLDAADRQTVSQALKRVGLAGFEKRKPATLSGGERQRAAFARALVRHRPLMLLDEPFAALDPGLRREMGTLLKELQQQEGFTVLMITHDPAEAARLADCAAYVEDGRIVLSEPIEAFLKRTEPASLARFFAANAV